MDTPRIDVRTIRVPLPDEAATRALGGALARAAKPGDVLLLDGPLGVGKTTLAKGFAAELGAAAAASPSFVVAHRYEGGPFPISHVDLYRLDSVAEIEALDLDLYLPDDGVSLIEWSRRAPGLWPSDRVEVVLAICGEGREATIVGRGTAASAVAGILAVRLQ